MTSVKKNFCNDCQMPSLNHIQTWLDEILDQCFPDVRLPYRLENSIEWGIEKILSFFNVVTLREDYQQSDILLRSFCFSEEMKKRGGKVTFLYGPAGYTNYFQIELQGKVYRFEGLPLADYVSNHTLKIVEDKEKTKQYLRKGGFPVAKSNVFWFWQKKKAIMYGIKIGFPLVVKPRSGSVSRHVTINIQNITELEKAISKAIAYSPSFIIEKFVSDASVHRVTVIDFDSLFCVKQVPANIVGDGISTIRTLIDKKNIEPNRGNVHQKEFTLYTIVENHVTTMLLKEKGYMITSIPKKDEVVFLQSDPFLKLGGDLVEVTPYIHPDNVKLFQDIAKFFDIRVVGIDCMVQDISVSYKEQTCAVLELNSVPCIELHHFPSSGEPQNVAKALVDLFFKYYVKD